MLQAGIEVLSLPLVQFDRNALVKLLSQHY